MAPWWDPWRPVEACGGGLRRAVEACGGLWRPVEGVCGGLWRPVEGPVVACGGLLRGLWWPVEACGVDVQFFAPDVPHLAASPHPCRWFPTLLWAPRK